MKEGRRKGRKEKRKKGRKERRRDRREEGMVIHEERKDLGGRTKERKGSL
jgi:hypothetical protein